MKTLMIIALLALASCGKNKSGGKPCKSRMQKIAECRQDYNPTHHPWYVERVCGEQYREEGCYK